MNLLTRSCPNGCSSNAALSISLSGSWRLVLRKLMRARPRSSIAAFSRKPVCAVRQRTRLQSHRQLTSDETPWARLAAPLHQLESLNLNCRSHTHTHTGKHTDRTRTRAYARNCQCTRSPRSWHVTRSRTHAHTQTLACACTPTRIVETGPVFQWTGSVWMRIASSHW
jgi:hypothetical protein